MGYLTFTQQMDSEYTTPEMITAKIYLQGLSCYFHEVKHEKTQSHMNQWDSTVTTPHFRFI